MSVMRRSGGLARRRGGGDALAQARELAVHEPQLRAQARGQLALQRLHLHQLRAQLLVVRAHLTHTHLRQRHPHTA